MNQKLQHLLDHYSESHRNPKNKLIHKFAVPLIMFSLLGLLFQISWGYFNAGWALVIFAIFYYLQFREWKVLLIALGQTIPMVVLIYLNPYPPIPVYLAVFVAAWIAQFIGHKIEGKKPSFFEDLQYLLVGPIWIFY